MLEIHELLGREVDPIDDVRRKFEESYTENYHNPLNGDWISDDYWDVINLTTQPGELTLLETSRLNRIISRLNGKYEHIQRLLGDSSLLAAYVSVAEQVTAINGACNSQTEIAPMHGAPQEAIPEINGWIANGNTLSSRGWDVVLGYPDTTGLSSESYFAEAQRCYEIAGRLGGVSVQSEDSAQASR